MTAVFDEDSKALTGTTAVDVVPDPGASQSEVLVFTVWNRDSVTRIVTVQQTGGTITPFELSTVELGAGKRGVAAGAIGAVVTNGQKIQAKSDATAASTEPAVYASWFKIP